ncbi:hypothetical protein M5E86_09475 [Blautia wexlerae]|nr:hypothetical protein M5E86_09475 [Blautia wexlerae]
MRPGMSCLSMLFATGTVTVSASDEITEIPEQSIVYWSMWEEDEPQADVIREAKQKLMKKQQVFL